MGLLPKWDTLWDWSSWSLGREVSLLDGERERVWGFISTTQEQSDKQSFKVLFLGSPILLSAGHFTQFLNSVYRRIWRT